MLDVVRARTSIYLFLSQRPLLYHYHPTVSLHARQLLSGDPITSSADLTLNTLSHFLDRFVYKNPKKPRARGMSAMQPDGTNVSGASVTRTRGEVAGGVLPNEEKFWNRKVEDVPVDEVGVPCRPLVGHGRDFFLSGVFPQVFLSEASSKDQGEEGNHQGRKGRGSRG